jgi:hypothetical protein
MFLAAQIHTPPACAAGNMTQNMCIKGAYSFVTSASTPAACCEACAADPQCLAWTLKDTVQNCALHNQSSHTKIDPDKCKWGGTLGVKPSPAPSPPSPGPSPPGALGFSYLFTEGAVLQRGKDVIVWGPSADVSGKVTLKLDGGAAVAGAGAAGRWTATLPAQPAGYNHALTVSDGTGATATVRRVSFGEVMLCAGQSNMGMQVGPSPRAFDADNSTAEAAAAGRYGSAQHAIAYWSALAWHSIAWRGTSHDAAA